MFNLITIFLSLLALSQSVRFDHPCRDSVSPIEEFDVMRYLGTWYEQQRYPFIEQANLDCVTAEYYLLSSGSVRVVNTGVDFDKRESFSAEGLGVLSFPDEEPLRGLLNVSFTGEIGDRVNYQVLATDYSTYSIVYSCDDIEDDEGEAASNEFAWVLSRTGRGFNEATVELVKSLLASFEIDAETLEDTFQDDLLCLLGITPFAKGQK